MWPLIPTWAHQVGTSAWALFKVDQPRALCNLLTELPDSLSGSALGTMQSSNWATRFSCCGCSSHLINRCSGLSWLQLQKRGTGPFITLISVSSLCQQIGPDLHSCQPDGAFTSSAPFQSLHTSNPLCLLPSFYFFQACLHWGHLIDGRAHGRRKNGSWRHEGSRWGIDQNGVLPAACKTLVI